jgi:hypothetical protein
MEPAFIAARQSIKVLAWIYTRVKKFKNPIDKSPEI